MDVNAIELVLTLSHFDFLIAFFCWISNRKEKINKIALNNRTRHIVN